METIEPVEAHNRAEAQELFREYLEFLRGTGSCGFFDRGGFDHEKFAEEIDGLPGAYADHGGELLLAMVDGVAAACIAYRSCSQPGSCEIKRLYVRQAYKPQGLARKLVAEALARVTALGYTRAILDTDVDNMAGALKLYRSFGFEVYAPQHGPIAFLDKKLP